MNDTIERFLLDSECASLDEWMEDSDYVQDEHGDWFYPADYADPSVAGAQVDPVSVIEGAIEASEYE